MVLFQENGEVQHQVACASRRLNRAERNYSGLEKECLAIIFGARKFQRVLGDGRLIVETSKEPLTYLKHAQHASSRLMHWSLILQEYNIKLRYIPGRENVQADYLSRSHAGQEE